MANEPVWVYITQDRVEVRDASLLWGKDTVETQEIIRGQIDNKNVQVACIGVSGEKLSLISGIVTDGGRLAARSGLGAIMGYKKLKAFAVHGDLSIPVARPEVVETINRDFLKEFKESKTADKLITRFRNFLGYLSSITGIPVPAQPSTVREILRRYGTCGFTAYYSVVGDMPIKNWGGVAHLEYPIENAGKISDENVTKYQKRRYACQACPLGCGGIIDIQKGRYRGVQGHKPEYETIGAFGGLLLHDNLDAIIEINEMCNRAGLDTISAGIYYVQLLNGCGLCIFGSLSSSFPIVEYLNAVTGWDLSADDYLRIGARILNIRKAFNVREGLTADDLKLNDRALGNPPLQTGPLKGVSINIEKLEKEFFNIVGWSYPSGGPTLDKMKDLGIDDLILKEFCAAFSKVQ